MREKLEQIILLDTEYSTNHNVDQLLWRSVYHQILENLRKELQEENNSETRTSISHILNEVTSQLITLLRGTSPFILTRCLLGAHSYPEIHTNLSLWEDGDIFETQLANK